MDIPAIMVSGGPMLNGYYRGERGGSGPHLWKFSEAAKTPSGAVVFEDIDDHKSRIDD